MIFPLLYTVLLFSLLIGVLPHSTQTYRPSTVFVTGALQGIHLIWASRTVRG